MHISNVVLLQIGNMLDLIAVLRISATHYLLIMICDYFGGVVYFLLFFTDAISKYKETKQNEPETSALYDLI